MLFSIALTFSSCELQKLILLQLSNSTEAELQRLQNPTVMTLNKGKFNGSEI